jgi:hypothetical protein
LLLITYSLLALYGNVRFLLRIHGHDDWIGWVDSSSTVTVVKAFQTSAYVRVFVKGVGCPLTVNGSIKIHFFKPIMSPPCRKGKNREL